MIWLSLNLDFFMQNLLQKNYEKILLLTPVIFRGDYPENGRGTQRLRNRRPIGCRVTSAAGPSAGLPAQSGSSNGTTSGQVYLLLT